MVAFVVEAASMVSVAPVIIPPALLVIVGLILEVILMTSMSSAEMVPELVIVKFVFELALIALSSPDPDAVMLDPDSMVMVVPDLLLLDFTVLSSPTVLRVALLFMISVTLSAEILC